MLEEICRTPDNFEAWIVHGNRWIECPIDGDRLESHGLSGDRLRRIVVFHNREHHAEYISLTEWGHF